MRAAQDGVDAGDQLLKIEWLRDVIVGAELEALQLVRLLAAGRQNNDRHFAGLSKDGAQVEAVEVGQREIEHDEIGR